MVDVVAGERQHDDANHDRPVHDPHRQLEHVDRAARRSRAAPSSRRLGGATVAISAGSTVTMVRAPRALGVEHVHGAGQARVERVDRAQQLERPRRVGDRRADQRLLVRPGLALRVARRRRSTSSARPPGSARSCRRRSPPSARASRAAPRGGRTRGHSTARSSGSHFAVSAIRRSPLFMLRSSCVEPPLQPAHHDLALERAGGDPARASSTAPRVPAPSFFRVRVDRLLDRRHAGGVGDQQRAPAGPPPSPRRRSAAPSATSTCCRCRSH